MVRKRSRSSRKYYDDENDSDSDFALEEPPREPAQKKYSLRQRKRRIFTEFEFDDDGDEIEPTKVPSDDDDFQVEKELELDGAPDNEDVDKQTNINHYEPENDGMPEDADGLIDFEDMIRADIVVNKNRIDYDNIIQKTEIKVHPIEDVEVVPPVVKSKRGRKPKARPEGEIDSSLLEPKMEMHEAEFEDKNDQDYNPADEDDDEDNDEPIDCAKLMHAELSESASELLSVQSSAPPNEINELISENNVAVVKLQEDDKKALTEKDVLSDSISNEQVSNQLINVAGENVKSENENLETNGEICPLECPNSHTTPEKLLSVPKEALEVDDDDVVLVEDEKKCEVIVLDD